MSDKIKNAVELYNKGEYEKAIDIFKRVYAKCNEELCVGCGICVKNCPAGALEVIQKPI